MDNSRTICDTFTMIIFKFKILSVADFVLPTAGYLINAVPIDKDLWDSPATMTYQYKILFSDLHTVIEGTLEGSNIRGPSRQDKQTNKSYREYHECHVTTFYFYLLLLFVYISYCHQWKGSMFHLLKDNFFFQQTKINYILYEIKLWSHFPMFNYFSVRPNLKPLLWK